MAESVTSALDVGATVRGVASSLRRLGVARIGLFGSFRRGEQSEKSDVDILISFERGRKSFDAFLGVAELLEASLHRRVDLVTVESLSLYIGPTILAEVEYVPLSDWASASHP